MVATGIMAVVAGTPTGGGALGTTRITGVPVLLWSVLSLSWPAGPLEKEEGRTIFKPHNS